MKKREKKGKIAKNRAKKVTKKTTKKVSKKTKKAKKTTKKKSIERKPPKPTTKAKRDHLNQDYPKIMIDWDDFDKLAALQCTLKEFAFHFNCSEETIEKRVKEAHGVTFKEYFGAKRQNGFISLRRLQYQSAQGESEMVGAGLKKKKRYIRYPNVQMQINLGQQWLGQKTQQETKHTEGAEPAGKKLSDLMKDKDTAKHLKALAEAMSEPGDK